MNPPVVDTVPAAAQQAPAASSARKVLVGLIGAGIQRSLTPAMHEAEAAALGLRLHYQLIDLDQHGANPKDLGMLVAAAQRMGFAGLNITYPCKQAVIPFLDELSEEAAAMGAVNTVVFDHGKAVGHNTDASGWRWGFERALPEADLARVVLLGAGGAGSAIAHAVLRMGAQQLCVVDSDAPRAAELVARLLALYAGKRVTAVDAAAALQGATGLIHATPTGMVKLPGLPLPASLLRPSLWVSEIVYFPIETALLRTARALGCAVADGGGMAVGQAVGAFERFTGLPADAARMRAHFLSLLGSR